MLLRKLLFVALAALCYLTLLHASFHACRNASQAVGFQKEAAAIADLSQARNHAWERVKSVATLGLAGESATELKARIDSQLEQARHHQAAARANGYAALGCGLLISLATFFLFPGDRTVVVLNLVFLSLVACAAGISAPLLSVVAQSELPVLGNTVFQFEAKSLLGSIAKLWSRSPTISIVICLCSIAVPLFKSAILVYTQFYALHSRVAQIAAQLSKWSMADVFAVALLIIFFSSPNDELTSIHPHIGLHFFLAYVLTSLACSSLAPASPKNG